MAEAMAPRVLLVSMPYASLERPSLGLGLLQALVRREGVHCETRYLAFDFAESLGLEDYLWISGEVPYTAFAGDWTFTEALYGERPQVDAAYLERVLQREWRLDGEALARVLRVRARCEPFLQHCLSSVPWGTYDLVGFTSTFEQNIASLALARRIKAAHPEVAIVFGGANWEGVMGRELHRRFPFVDVVCSGEADASFPAVVAALAADRSSLESVAGIVYRDADGRPRATGPAPLITDLDGLPIPDFDSFFNSHAQSPAAGPLTPALVIETGRGCWWGAKSHCTFCGLNGGSMMFRAKQPERALAELRELRDRYGSTFFSVADNILDMRYFRSLLPRLAEEEQGISLFYEVKANLSCPQVALLAAAGVDIIQPGIESFSDHVLKLMGKGTTALQNVQLLKWCREHAVRPEWNLLYGFPGERPEDYEETDELLAAIDFLDPPSGYGPVRLDRFSPYHADPEGAGMINVRAMAVYRYLYPFAPDVLDRLAYYFDYEYADGRDPLAYAGPVVDRVRRWMRNGPRGDVWRTALEGDELVAVDARADRHPRAVRLESWRAAAYDACDRVRTLRGLGRLPQLSAVPDGELLSFLDDCVSQGLMVRRGDSFLALAVHRPARSWNASLGATPETAGAAR